MRITLATLFLSIVISDAHAASQWVRIGPGPSLEYAKAYCDNASMGVGTSMYAYGSTDFVIGAQLGNAIGNLITQSRFFTNCMTMHGWKKMRVKSGKTTSAQSATQVYRERSAREVLGTKCYAAKSMADMLKHC